MCLTRLLIWSNLCEHSIMKENNCYSAAWQSTVSLDTKMPNFFIFLQQQLQNKEFTYYERVFQQMTGLWVWVVAQQPTSATRMPWPCSEGIIVRDERVACSSAHSVCPTTLLGCLSIWGGGRSCQLEITVAQHLTRKGWQKAGRLSCLWLNDRL